MSKNALVSVIIPCFNGEKVIDTSIRSVYEQDYNNIQLIIVDDGSTDNSKSMILKWKDLFVQKSFQFQYVFQNNRGLAGAIDTGLKYVSGEYLTLLDADDYYLQGSISKRVSFLEEHVDYAGVRTNGWMVKGSKRKLFITTEKEKKTTDYFHALIFDGATNWAGSYMVRTKILFDFYPTRDIYPSRYGQNMQIILPVAYKRKFGVIDEPLMVYVLQSNSLSQADSIKKKREKDDNNFYGYYDIYQRLIQMIIEDENEKTEYIKRIQSWLYRHECNKALETNDVDSLRIQYRQLIRTGNATIKDKIKFNTYINPLLAVLYRIERRIFHTN